ncbi:imidazole glycerol phosphate synthase subunit HisH [Aquimonas sp.]|jgi:glutamine amidotransferase|uniref:imidazole glycerol phosphate synthase subunit HisH n=1 Tax=Aquimonas sp. TaxID=1872588 RepID=UPI0037BE82D9
MRLAVIDSGVANIGSVCYALERLGVQPQLVRSASELGQAERALLPGVGAAGAAMARLRELDLIEAIRSFPRPLFGICLGMQLLFERSAEGGIETLGLIPGPIEKLPEFPGVRVPHMGWNRLQRRVESPLLEGIPEGAQAYFVHSYAAPVGEWTLASSTHGEPFSAIVRRGNVAGAQFHPERSAVVGAQLLKNFIEWDGQ